LKNSISSLSRTDWWLLQVLRAGTALSASLVVLIALFLLAEALPVLSHIGVWPFVDSTSWNPTEGLFNMSPMLWGSLAASFGAVTMAVPLALGMALFHHFYGPKWFAHLLQNLLEVMGGIPSVVFGLWGLVILVPKIAEFKPPGTSLLAGILILSMMILPGLALAFMASFQNIPKELQMQGAALGFSHYRAFKDVYFPMLRARFFSVSILQFGRALGETMAVLMVCGNVVQSPSSIFDPVRTLTTNIALEMAYATGSHRSALFVSGLMLLLCVAVLVLMAHLIESRGQKK
jgi:phosphate transport system permease protein